MRRERTISPWLELIKRKPFSDLIGNNINHPNDFGHRVYADVICQIFPLATESSGVRETTRYKYVHSAQI